MLIKSSQLFTDSWIINDNRFWVQLLLRKIAQYLTATTCLLGALAKLRQRAYRKAIAQAHPGRIKAGGTVLLLGKHNLMK